MRLYLQRKFFSNFKPVVMLSRYLVFVILIAVPMLVAISCNDDGKPATDKNGSSAKTAKTTIKTWTAPDSNAIPQNKTGDMIRYGKELLAHTAVYFGPNGSIAQLSNGMNCQNCHLEGGSRIFANNYS